MSEDETSENIDNKFVDTVSAFLLNRDIRDVCTLNEMRSNFPSKYRTHDDINVLYESFVAKRKLIKDTVRKNIEEFYKKENTKDSKEKEETIEEKVAVLNVKQRQFRKELSRAKKELSVLQKNITRCNEAVQDCQLLAKDVEEYFSVDMFEV